MARAQHTFGLVVPILLSESEIYTGFCVRYHVHNITCSHSMASWASNNFLITYYYTAILNCHKLAELPHLVLCPDYTYLFYRPGNSTSASKCPETCWLCHPKTSVLN